MNLAHLTWEDWEEFGQRFPKADAWLGHKALLGELACLRRQERPTDWERERLAELEAWKAGDDLLAKVGH